MKKWVFLALAILCVTLTIPAEPLTGFLGVSFGSSMDDAKTAMAPRNFGEPFKGANLLVWEKAKFAGRDATLFFSFYNGKLYDGLAIITADNGKAFSTYNSMKDDMTAKYGEPTDNIEQYKYPYTKGDGHEETALYANAATIFCRWVFDSGDFIHIMLHYDKPSTSNEVVISYIYKVLNDASLDKTNTTNQRDL